jgi:hypothetical protein
MYDDEQGAISRAPDATSWRMVNWRDWSSKSESVPHGGSGGQLKDCPRLFVYYIFFLFFAVCVYGENIDIVYHVGMMNNWEEVVGEQLRGVEEAGLGEACDSMQVTLVGPRKYFERAEQIFSAVGFREKVFLHYAGRDLSLYEFPGIEMVQRVAQEKPGTRIFYFHNKGVTHFRKKTEGPTTAWRRYMEYFMIERWRECLVALEEADTCGVEYTVRDYGIPLFGGNFWWANASYVQTCHLSYDNRYDCERFIGTGLNAKMKCFHNAPPQYHLYYDCYSEENYRK